MKLLKLFGKKNSDKKENTQHQNETNIHQVETSQKKIKKEIH